MTRSSLRALRLATAAATIGGICAVSAAPALADSGISYFNGSATGQAVSLTVSPSSVLNVNLAGIQSQLNSLPLGAGQTINNVAGSTLQNPTAPITVQIDASHAQGVAQKGVQLSDGSASSTAVSIDAASLKSEVTLLNAMLQHMPQGPVTALDNALSPITSNDPT